MEGRRTRSRARQGRSKATVTRIATAQVMVFNLLELEPSVPIFGMPQPGFMPTGADGRWLIFVKTPGADRCSCEKRLSNLGNKEEIIQKDILAGKKDCRVYSLMSAHISP